MLNGIYFLSHNQPQIKGMTMYQIVYDLCVASPKSLKDELFNGIADYLQKHTLSQCNLILSHDDIVTAYAKAFDRFALAAEYMSRGCHYLDRINVSNPPVRGAKYKKQNVEAVALSQWKHNVLYVIRDHNQNKLFYQVFEWIRQDRNGDSAPHNIIKSVVTSLVQVNAFTEQPLQLYIEEFERPYLVHTKRYYAAEAAREIASGSVSHFMERAYDRLQQEITRNNQYCHSTSHGRIVREFEAQYIMAYQEYIIDEFGTMLKDERFHDCTLAYKLLGRLSDGLKTILDIYESYITKIGKDILSQLGSSVVKNPKPFVEQLLGLHSKYYKVNIQVFEGHSLFTASVDKAFRTIINDSSKASGPETLARYCDMMLKKSSVKKDINTSSGQRRRTKKEAEDDQEDQEEKLTKMITLFKYVDDKDVFQKFYSRMLAKRLIYNASSSEELEVNMINRLKEICGVEYTSKLNKMFTDITLSSDLNSKFKTHIKDNQLQPQGNVEALVLTAGAWPLNQKDDASSETNKLLIPTVLENNITWFESFYGKLYNGRKLLWQWNLTRGEIRVNYFDKSYELQVSMYQMIMLLLFNDSQKMTIQDIMNRSGLSMTETVRNLRPLIELCLLTSSEELNASSNIEINSEFSSKRLKIKVGNTAAQQQTENQQETLAARKSVEEDRRMYIQAAIVRIMKSRQTLPHVQLIQEILDQSSSRFSPSVSMIKKCIEQLMEKQFIARKEKDCYVYVA
ncbi:Cullin [Sporodiniella umbellata]|nr:Cullin [Sporodiniella umbellata]